MVEIIIKKHTCVQFNNITKLQKACSVKLLIPLKEHHLFYWPKTYSGFWKSCQGQG